MNTNVHDIKVIFANHEKIDILVDNILLLATLKEFNKKINFLPYASFSKYTVKLDNTNTFISLAFVIKNNKIDSFEISVKTLIVGNISLFREIVDLNGFHGISSLDSNITFYTFDVFGMEILLDKVFNWIVQN